MKPFLIVTAQGNVSDRTQLVNLNLSGSTTYTFVGGLGATFSTGAITLNINQSAQSGQWATWNGSNVTWQGGGTPPEPVGPKYISAVGGVYFKDQKDEIIKYQSLIAGSFNNIRE